MTQSSVQAPSCVKVNLGDRSYDIHIGTALLNQVPSLIKPLLARPRTIIVTDDNVGALYADNLAKILSEADIKTDIITLPKGEGTKNFAHLESLLEQLIGFDVERNDIIIALGGGVIGDITGFAAAILRRGCRFVQIPTSLLAQVDSSVGGKTAINSRKGKNLIGAFYQPEMVIVDIDVLDTLPPRQVKAGYAEIVKYGLLGDIQFFEWLEANSTALFAGDKKALAEAVRRSCQAKADIVAEDEREQGRRALLNLGHTFGHAFEAVTGYSDRLFHGEGVALGMVLAFQFSQKLGLCTGQETTRVHTHLKAAALPVAASDIIDLNTSADELLDIMYQDKKVQDGALTFILTNGIGDAFVEKNVSPAPLKEFLTEILQS